MLAAVHTRCGKHRSPKENLGILRGALEEMVAGRPLDAWRLGLLRHAVAARHARLRGTLRAAPGAGGAGGAAVPPRPGPAGAAPAVRAPAGWRGGRDRPARRSGVRGRGAAERVARRGAGSPAIRRSVGAALSAPVGSLVERGVVPSADVLAELVPRLVASTTAQAYEDGALRTLMAATYRAFRNRRSLLLVNLRRQARVGGCPGCGRCAPARPRGDPPSGAHRAAAAGRAGGAGLPWHDPAQPPRPRARRARPPPELDTPLVEELAADIFMGTFTPKFLEAGRPPANCSAARCTSGTTASATRPCTTSRSPKRAGHRPAGTLQRGPPPDSHGCAPSGPERPAPGSRGRWRRMARCSNSRRS